MAILVGEPLSQHGHAVDMVTLGFGPIVEVERRGDRFSISEHWLHLQERWRITRGGAVQVGFADWFYPPADSDVAYEDFVARDARRSRRDDLIEAWQAHQGADHHVARASGTDAGDLRIAFADGCALETFVDQASSGDADELWRLLPPRSTSDGQPHFVVKVGGLGDS